MDTSGKTEKKQLNILAIEDDQTIIRLYRKVLEPDGHTVVEAGTGAAAIKMLEENRFDLICLDLKLPDMDGAELLNVIRNQIEWIPVIIVTANPSVESSVEAVNAGVVTEYVLKPFDTKELSIIVHKSVEKAKLAIENKRLLKKLENTNQALLDRVEQLEDFAKDAVKAQGKILELSQYVKSLEEKIQALQQK